MVKGKFGANIMLGRGGTKPDEEPLLIRIAYKDRDEKCSGGGAVHQNLSCRSHPQRKKIEWVLEVTVEKKTPREGGGERGGE